LHEGEPLKITCFSHTIPVWTYRGLSGGVQTEYMEVKKKYVFGNTIMAPEALENEHMGTFYCKGTTQSGHILRAPSKVYVGCKYQN